MLEVQEKNDLPAAIAIVIRSGQQICLPTMRIGSSRRSSFDPSDEGDVRRVRPAGMASPVVIDPLVRFGRPSVEGVATERLWELVDAGESVEAISAGYDMEQEQIREAVSYEEQLRSLAA